MSRLNEFARIVNLPPIMFKYAHLVAEEQEMEWVMALDGRAMNAVEIAKMMSVPFEEAESFLARAVRRAVMDKKNKDGMVVYSPGTFYRRLTYLSMQDYDEWRRVPWEDRRALLDWHLQENILHHDLVRKLALLKQDLDSVTLHNRDILLLDEALALVEAAALHVVVPCDCRTTVMACDFPRWNTCFRLDERGLATRAQGEGRIVSKEECREILVNADRVGLLHTGQRAEKGRKAILNGNCCACCSYPIRAGIALDMDKQWPRAHYVAERSLSQCDNCGTCVTRCHFHAFYFDTARATTPVRVEFDPGQCHGCGLCATGCPKTAIHMEPLPG